MSEPAFTAAQEARIREIVRAAVHAAELLREPRMDPLRLNMALYFRMVGPADREAEVRAAFPDYGRLLDQVFAGGPPNG